MSRKQPIKRFRRRKYSSQRHSLISSRAEFESCETATYLTITRHRRTCDIFDTRRIARLRRLSEKPESPRARESAYRFAAVGLCAIGTGPLSLYLPPHRPIVALFFFSSASSSIPRIIFTSPPPLSASTHYSILPIVSPRPPSSLLPCCLRPPRSRAFCMTRPAALPRPL